MPSAPVLVVLAAGESVRLGEPKALVDLGGTTPLAALLEAGRAATSPDPLVVAGADFGALRSAAPAGVEVLEHAAWSEGRTGSVRAARRARPDRDLLLAPVDVPLVPAAVFAALAAAWRERGAPARGWVAPAVRAGGELRTGHPVLLGRVLLRELDEMDPDEPLRGLRDRADPLWRVEVESERILDDLDTLEDLKELRGRAR